MTETRRPGSLSDRWPRQKLIDWIRKNLCPDSRTANGPTVAVIIFTEYDDTKRYLRQPAGGRHRRPDRAEERIAVYHGPTPSRGREEIKRAFNADPSKHPLRILIATDAAREGLNLQAHCWNLFHFDVPWNPGRMEQRNGRIDRKLQPQRRCLLPLLLLHAAGRGPHPQSAGAKDEDDQEGTGSLSQVIEEKLAVVLGHGIRHADADRLAATIDAAHLEAEARAAVEEELEAARDRRDKLKEQVDGLRTRIQESREWVGFDEGHFNAALSCALEVLKAEPLMPDGDGAGGPRRFVFPALDARTGADPTWAETLDALRVPRRRDQKLWEWRREAPLRPVVFDDPGKMTEEVVQLHLEHRVVQRLLGRFTAQGFVHHDLSPGLPGPVGGLDPARRPDRPALPVRPRRRPLARGTDRGLRPLGGPGITEGQAPGTLRP